MFENYAFCGVGTLLSHAWISYIERKRDVTYITSQREATSGLEPLVQLLQSRALPLGDVAALRYGERETGIEPATFSLARRCSTTEPLPLVPFAMLTLLHFCNPVCVIKISYLRPFVNRFLRILIDDKAALAQELQDALQVVRVDMDEAALRLYFTAQQRLQVFVGP